MNKIALLACTSIAALSVSPARAQSVTPFAMEPSDTVYAGHDSAGSGSLETSPGRQVIFRDDATASSAHIINNGGTTRFEGRATAASASLTANDGGGIRFSKQSTAADSRIVANGGGELNFSENASAGAAFVTTNGATRFSGSSTANRAVITVNGTGSLAFDGNSRAEIAQITNNGQTTFSGNASLQGASIVNNEGSSVAFSGSASGGTTSFISNSGAVTFTDNSSLNSGAITGNASSSLRFAGRASAGDGFISTSGEVAFSEASTAGSAEIIGNAGSRIAFSDDSSAGTAEISGGAELRFAGRASAGAASITMSPGATITFADNADGGSAKLHLDSGAALDISAAANDVGLGSLSGAGDVRLGQRTLAVGDDTPLVDFAGTIGDGGQGGGLVKRDSGALNLSGKSNYSGATRVAAGTLEAGAENTFSASSAYTVDGGATLSLAAFDQTIGSLAGAGTVDLATATLTTGGNGQSTRFDGAITGTGGLTKQGNGELTLAGTNAYFGPTRVLGGALRVDGSIANSAVSVAENAALSGSGEVKSAAIAGTLYGGDGLSVLGDLSLAPDSTLVAYIGPGAAGLSVGGTATLGGRLDLRPAGTIDPALAYEILHAGTINGTFDTVEADFAFLDPDLIYGADTLSVRLERNNVAFADVAQTPNQRTTAQAVETLGNGNDVFDAVLPTNVAGARAAFDNLSGEGHANVLDTMTAARDHARRAVLERLRQRTGNGIQVWTTAQGARDRRKSDGNGAEAEIRSVSVIGGVDFQPNENVTVGVFGGYGRSDISSPARRTSGDVDTASLGVYGSYKQGNLRLRAGAQAARHQASLQRQVDVGPLQGVAASDYSGWSAEVFGEAGYNFDIGGVSVEPYVGISHFEARTDGFQESGAGAANLYSGGNRVSRTDLEVGVRAGTTYVTPGGMRVRPSVAVAYQRNLHGAGSTSRHHFAGGPEMAISSSLPGVDAALVEARVDVDVTQKLEAGVFYRGTWARHGDAHLIGAGLTYHF